MGRGYSNINDAVDDEFNWMIGHGLYKKNILSNIMPYLSRDSKFYVVKFEDLLSDSGVTYRALMEILEIDVTENAKLPKYNKSMAARNPILLKLLKIIFNKLRFIMPNLFIGFLKKSMFIEVLFFSETKKLNFKRDDFDEYKKYFIESERFINQLNFINGIARLDKND